MDSKIEKDVILEKFFENSRWEYAIEKGIIKDIPRKDLYQLTKPDVRLKLYSAIKNRKYSIAPPHTAKIPKDEPGKFRIVYINEPIDRIVLSIANDLLFDLTPDAIHPRCKSYLRGVGCGMVVQEMSKEIGKMKSDIVGFKSDLKGYFDNIKVEYIDKAFDMVESRYGKSALIDVLREYYHSDYYFDTEGEFCNKYQSLKQGCSVASWLADVILHDVDEKMYQLNKNYVRYSDDVLFIGDNYKEGYALFVEELGKMCVSVNEKKSGYLSKSEWFKFLGFSIKDDMISLSSSRIKTFQEEIESRTVKSGSKDLKTIVDSVNNYLYRGNGEFSWATQVLPIVNVEKDILQLDKFVMDAIRASVTGKKKIGGIGYVKNRKDSCISRGKGRHVKSNLLKTDKVIDGYITLGCMQKAIKTSKDAYRTLVRNL